MSVSLLRLKPDSSLRDQALTRCTMGPIAVGFCRTATLTLTHEASKMDNWARLHWLNSGNWLGRLMIWSAPLFHNDFRTVTIICNYETNAMSFPVNVDWSLLLLHKDPSQRRRPAMNLSANLLPPCRITTHVGTKSQVQAFCCFLATELHPQEGPVLVCEGLPIIQVKLTSTLVSNKDADREWSMGSPIRALNHGRDGQDRACACEDGELIKRGRDANCERRIPAWNRGWIQRDGS